MEKVRLSAKCMKWYLSNDAWHSFDGDKNYHNMIETILYMRLFRDEYIGELGPSNGYEGEDEAWKITFPNGYWAWFEARNFYKAPEKREDRQYKPEYF